jgi:hypothetical protein
MAPLSPPGPERIFPIGAQESRGTRDARASARGKFRMTLESLSASDLAYQRSAGDTAYLTSSVLDVIRLGPAAE